MYFADGTADLQVANSYGLNQGHVAYSCTGTCSGMQSQIDACVHVGVPPPSAAALFQNTESHAPAERHAILAGYT